MNTSHQEIARCLFRESNDALFIFDPSDHRVVDVNPAALRITGFDKDVACAKTLGDLFTSEQSGGLGRLIEAYRRTGFYHSREGYSLGRESGKPIPVNVSVSRIHTEPAPLGLVVARDITERVAAQEALRESEQRYRSLIETAKVIIWAVSDVGLVGSWNPAFEALTGRSLGAWVGRRFAELIHPDDRPGADEFFGRALLDPSPSPPPFELRILAESGEPHVIEVLSVSRQTAGGRSSVSAFARDVTERKRAEEAINRSESLQRSRDAAVAADRAKSEFLGNVSHEIRTPMTAVLGFTDILLEDERVRALPADLLDHLRTIKQNGTHLLDLINDILDLTKIEVGKLRIERAACSPARVLDDVSASMRPEAEAKGLSLTVDFPPGGPATVLTDPVRLRQILINLVGNAVKFTERGGVQIRAGRDGEAGGAASIRFDVIDTGVGVSEDDMGRLFDLFYTSDLRTTRETGSGLGLAISRHLAELLGGRITVRSRRGAGSVFSLTIPVGDAGRFEPSADPGPGPAAAGAGPGPPGPTRLGGRVLVAEDNESIRRFLVFRLEQAGSEVAAARNGQEAVDLASAASAAGRPFDWVLMDVQMPVMDGFEATRILRGSGYRWPIIALTAFAVDKQREDCLRFGCDDHVSKPVDWAGLVDVLNAHRGKVRASETPAPGTERKPADPS